MLHAARRPVYVMPSRTQSFGKNQDLENMGGRGGTEREYLLENKRKAAPHVTPTPPHSYVPSLTQEKVF